MNPRPLKALAAAVLALAACTRELPGGDALLPQERVPIGFSVQAEANAEANAEAGAAAHRDTGHAAGAAPAATTRSTSGLLSVSDLKETGFGVFACYTAHRRYSESSVTSDFMHNEPVSWDADHDVWTYAPLKYWPNGEGEAVPSGGTDLPHRVSFFAYAPYSDGAPATPAGYCIPSMSYPTERSDPWILYRLHPDVAQQVDLLCAVPQLDQSRSGVADKVPFLFKHALASVGDTFTVEASAGLRTLLKNTVDAGVIGADEALLQLTDVTVTYTLLQKARLVLWNQGTPNWQSVMSEDAMTTRTLPLLSGTPVTLYQYNGSTENARPWTDPGRHGVLFIPLEVGPARQQAAIRLHYTLLYRAGGAVVEQRQETATAVLDLDAAAPESGKHLAIQVQLQP